MTRRSMSIELLARPQGRWMKRINLALRFYLCLFVVGCAATRPKPTVEEARSMETRTLRGHEEMVFKACVGVLQDLGYSVDVANAEAGLITASRQTQERSGEITEEREDPKGDGGMPTWAKVLLVCTGVILVVFIVAAITGSDKDKDTKNVDDNGGDNSSGGKKDSGK